MAEPARRLDPGERGCPRVVGAGRRVVTCGHTIPCPYHGEGLHVVEAPPSAGEEETE